MSSGFLFWVVEGEEAARAIPRGKAIDHQGRGRFQRGRGGCGDFAELVVNDSGGRSLSPLCHSGGVPLGFPATKFEWLTLASSLNKKESQTSPRGFFVIKRRGESEESTTT